MVRKSGNPPMFYRCFWLGLSMVLLSLQFGCGMGSSSPEEHMQKAIEYQQSGDSKAAIIELKNVLKQEPDNSNARWMLGNLYLEVGDGESAIKELSRAVQLGIKGAENEHPLVRAYFMRGRFQDALDQLEGEEKTAEVLVLRGQGLLGLKKTEEAKSEFEAALEMDAASLDALLGLATIHLQLGDTDNGLAQVEKALAVDNGFSRAWLLKGDILFVLQQPDAAIEAFQKATDDEGLKLQAALGVARVQVSQKNFAAAGAELKKVLTELPEHPMANYLQAVIYAQEDNLEAANLALQTVFKRSVDYPPALLLMGSVSYRLGQMEQAGNYLSRLVASQPSHIPGRKLLASVRIASGQVMEAIEILEPVVDETTRDAALLAQLGGAYLKIGKLEKGSDFLERAALIAPDNAPIKTQLAITKLQTGKIDEAIHELEVVVAMDDPPDMAEILLVSHRLRSGDFMGALKIVTALIEREPDNPVAYNLQGATFLQLKRPDDAKKAYLTALEKKGDFHPAAMNLANLAIQNNDEELAKGYLKGILSQDDSYEPALISLAKMEEAGGDLESVVALLEKARAGNPKALQSRLLLANYYLRVGPAARAKVIIDEAKSNYPESPPVQFLYARISNVTGDYSEAINTLNPLLEREPENVDFLLQMSVAQLATKNIEQARELLQKIMGIDSNYPPAIAGMFSVEMATKNYSEAEKLAKHLVVQNPESALGYTLMGDLFSQSMAYEKARTNYKRAQEIAPSSNLVSKLFQVEKAAGNLSAGIDILGQWVAKHPKDDFIAALYASNQQQVGNSIEAKKAYQSLLEKKPENVGVLNNLAWLYYEEGDLKRALELAEKAWRLAPGRAEVIDTYGWILLDSDKKKALFYLGQAAELMPESGDIQFHLAAALVANDKKKNAEAILSSILAEGAPGFSEKDKAKALFDSLK